MGPGDAMQGQGAVPGLGTITREIGGLLTVCNMGKRAGLT